MYEVLKIKWLEIVIKVFLCLFILSMLIVIHEMAHCLTAELLGGGCNGIGFNWEEFYAYANLKCDNIVCTRGYLLSGSFIAGTVAAMISFITEKKECGYLYFISSCYLCGQFMYWAISPIFEFGDAYNLIKGTNINIVLFCAIFFVISIYILIKTIIGCVKIWEKKMKLEVF